MHSKSKIYINPIGGLANRMRALISGMSLAEKMQADYRVIWLKNWELNAGIGDIFKLPEGLSERIVYPSALEYGLLYSSPRKKNMYITALTEKLKFGCVLSDQRPLMKAIQSQEDYAKVIENLVSESIENRRDVLLQGGTILYPFSEDEYRRLFIPNEEIERKVADVANRLGHNYIGVHIRRSDNLQSILHSTDEMFIAELDERVAADPDVRIYLATDDEATKAKFKAIYGERLLCSPLRASRGDLEGIKNAAVEMYVLSRAKSIIGSHYSSFSEAAAMLGECPVKQLYRVG